jgi:hypothetical protein
LLGMRQERLTDEETRPAADSAQSAETCVAPSASDQQQVAYTDAVEGGERDDSDMEVVLVDHPGDGLQKR